MTHSSPAQARSSLTQASVKIAALTALAFATLCAPALAGSADTGALTVTVTGAQAGLGPLYLTVQTEDQYRKPMQTQGGIYKDIAGGTLTYHYTGIPAGDYAISLWHDLDRDGQFSMREDYVPADGWGTSGDFDKKRAPIFDDVKFSVNSNGAAQTVALIYPE